MVVSVGIEVLVPLLMGALLKVAGKVGEGALDAVQDASKEHAAGILAKIRAWWSPDRSASEDLEKFQAEPEIYQPVVQSRLIQKLQAQPEMVAELAAAVKATGPQVEVFQTIAEAHGITGAKIQEMLGGQVRVTQNVRNASDVTGVDIGHLG
jgi:hypothetical protein